MNIMYGLTIMMLRSKLRRIIKNKKLSDANKTRKIEHILRRTKLPALPRLLRDDPDAIEEAVAILLGHDTCSLCSHGCDIELEERLKCHLSEIRGYHQLKGTVESMRRIAYNGENIHHEGMLLQLWERLCPNVPLRARVTKQWTEIGFQGRNPRTDFRGMGILGLHNLLFLANQYPERTQEMLNHSRHEKYGYSFAIVGINMTSLAYNLLCRDLLKPYMYSASRGPSQLHHFHNFYCYLVSEFDRFWVAEKPTDLMQFTHVKAKFEKKILAELSNKNIVINHGFTRSDCQGHNKFLEVRKSWAVTDVKNENDIMNTSYYLWV